MQNLLRLASYMSSVLSPLEALGFGIRSRESGKQGSWDTETGLWLWGGEGMVSLANNAYAHNQILSWN